MKGKCFTLFTCFVVLHVSSAAAVSLCDAGSFCTASSDSAPHALILQEALTWGQGSEVRGHLDSSLNTLLWMMILQIKFTATSWTLIIFYWLHYSLLKHILIRNIFFLIIDSVYFTFWMFLFHSDVLWSQTNKQTAWRSFNGDCEWSCKVQQTIVFIFIWKQQSIFSTSTAIPCCNWVIHDICINSTEHHHKR